MARLQLFGRPAWDGQALPAARSTRLLAVLALDGEWVTRERLSRLFWPDHDTVTARANLRKLLLEARRLALPGVEEGAAGLRWCVDSDLSAFRDAIARGDWAAAGEQVRGPLLQGLEAGNRSPAFDAWLAFERHETWRRWRDGALQALTTAPPSASVLDATCARLLAAEPMDEEVLATWLRLARAGGAPAAAEAALRRHAQQLADELGLAPSARLQALAAPAQAAPAGPAAPRALLGRAAELARGVQILAEGGRWLTLLGPGGVGKTLLAQHLQRAVASRFSASWFVPLEDLATPSALPGRVAEQLEPGLALREDPLATLAARWPAGPTLMVLDGCEVLVDVCPWLEQLLARVPGLQLVLTSRERLDAGAEWLLPLASLGAPPANASADEVLRHPAARLFAEHARRVAPGLDVQHEWHAVRRICDITEGLPLALELAAAWCRVMPVADIAHELGHGPALLSDGSQTRSMQAVFERSWALLTPAERGAFSRLAIFRGGFTRAAAQQVAGVGLPLLASLVDKSMLRVGGPGRDRFDCHALLHEQARARLAAQPELEAAMAEAHGRWCLALLQRSPGPTGPDARRQTLVAERDNLLAAWGRWVARRDGAAVVAAAGTLSWFHVVEGRLPDALALFDAAALAFGEGSVTGSQMRGHQAWLALWLDQLDRAEALAGAALRVLLAAGPAAPHRRGQVLALRTLAHGARRRGRHAASSALLGRALRLARPLADAGLRAMLLDARAMALLMLGRHTRAAALARGAMALNQRVGDEGQRMYNEFNLSQALGFGGDTAGALVWAEAALQRAERIGYRFFQPYTRCQRAALLLQQGRVDDAAADIDAAARAAVGMGGAPALVWVHELRARLALARGALGEACGAAREGAALALATGNLMLGAALVPAAARAELGAGRAARARAWLGLLLACPEVQAPARDEALALGGRPAARGELTELLRRIAEGR